MNYTFWKSKLYSRLHNLKYNFEYQIIVIDFIIQKKSFFAYIIHITQNLWIL